MHLFVCVAVPAEEISMSHLGVEDDRHEGSERLTAVTFFFLLCPEAASSFCCFCFILHILSILAVMCGV